MHRNSQVEEMCKEGDGDEWGVVGASCLSGYITLLFLVKLRFLRSHCRNNSMREKVIGKWIYLERKTVHR